MEVFPLASKHFSLNMSELGDVTDLLYAFEQQNKVKLHCRFGVELVGKNPTLGLTMLAYDAEHDSAVQPPLGSVSVICSTLNLKTWNAALTHALYALDFQLALNEFESKAPKRA
jgi:hypothetical protein